MKNQENQLKPWQQKLHEIIYEADTPAGKLFDILLIAFILMSITVVMLESVKEIKDATGPTLYILEWFFTIVFTIEYIVRILCISRPRGYIFSFFGIVDLLAVLPTYLTLFVQSQSGAYLAVIRILRVLRIFRVLKLTKYLTEANILIMALKASKRKVLVFLSTVVVLVTLLGALMFLVENGHNDNFSSIPRSVYWAVVTITTVGYGDISPVTPLGQFLAMVAMIMGYAIIAVPTGIVTVELNEAMKKRFSDTNTHACNACSAEGHDNDAKHCKYCGEEL